MKNYSETQWPYIIVGKEEQREKGKKKLSAQRRFQNNQNGNVKD